MRAVLAVWLVGLAVSGCSQQDPLFCDESTPCSDPDRPFCDLRGEFPGSAGVGNTCIPDPFADGADAGPDDEVDAASTCLVSPDCPGSDPICREGTCRDCRNGPGGHEECAERDPATPICQDGECIQCLGDGECGGDQPICDRNVCRGCRSAGECAGGLCDLDTGACPAAADMIFVDSDSGADGAGCGSGPVAAACETIGGADGALAKVTAVRKYVRLAGGTAYPEAIAVDGIDLYVAGEGSVIDPLLAQNTPAMSVRSGARVTIVGVTVQGADGTTSGNAVDCAGSSTVHLFDAVVRDCDAAGVRADNCSVAIARTLVDDNAVGVEVLESELVLRESTVSNNSLAGVVIDESPFELVNDIVARNGGLISAARGGVAISNSAAIATAEQLVIHATIVQNLASVGAAGIRCDSKNAVLAPSNIVYLNAGGPAFDKTCAFFHSDVQGGAIGQGNIDVAPTFVDADGAVGDFHLVPASAGIDAAAPDSPLTSDVDGDDRPQGAGFDMGADEVPR